MTELLLVRHGRAAGRWWTWWRNPPLAPAGVAQAQQVAEQLASQGRSFVLYTSPLRRAELTAQIIGHRLDLTPIVDPSLREASGATILVLGLLLGLHRLGLTERLGVGVATACAVLAPGFGAFCRRIAQAIDRIVERHPSASVVVVSHGGAIRAALAHLLPKQAQLCWSAEVDCGSLFRIHVDKGDVSLVDVDA